MGSIKSVFKAFFESEKTGGLILLLATAVSLLLANSSVGENYIALWDTPLNGHSITHWINDGLMAIFFLLIGLELEREVYNGELSDIKNAAMPIFGALGGILLPAAIFYFLNKGSIYQNGIGIPMATDIAFAIGVLSLLGNRVPLALKVFLTALAIIDDLGAILVIAIFYSKGIVVTNLLISLGIFVAMLVLNRLKVYNIIPYLVGGVAMWYFMLNSGVHATITGVLTAFAIPFAQGDEKSISIKLQHALHYPVAFVILPLFALANTAIAIPQDWSSGLYTTGSLGIILGLLLGKPVGIFFFTKVCSWFGLGKLSEDLRWKDILGAGILAGIGFTMSIFISLLAYTDATKINQAKIAILSASILAGITGFIFLKIILRKAYNDNEELTNG